MTDDCCSSEEPSAGAGANLPCDVTTQQCPLKCPDVEIQVNNTATADDDIVFLKCDANRHKIDCRIRATSASSSAKAVLVNPDGRLRFPEDRDTTKTISLPDDGSWVNFQISGQVGSDAIGDAVIVAHCDQSDGPVKATIGVSVMWIEPEGLYHLPPAAPAHSDVERLPAVNDLSMLPIADHIAHGTVKFTFKPTAKTAGMSAEWSLAPTGPDGGAMRGTMPVAPAAHNTHLEQEPGFHFDPATMSSTIDPSGIAAIRINMPSVGWNRGRLGVRFVDDPGCVTEIDFEVPAVVVIDPGHGGPDLAHPGDIYGGSRANNATGVVSRIPEKTMTLDMSRSIRDLLRASPRNIKVVLTRDVDENRSMAERRHTARDNAADIFLSIHFNASNGHHFGTIAMVFAEAHAYNHDIIQPILDWNAANPHLPPRRLPRGGRLNAADQVNHAEDRALADRIVAAVQAPTVNPLTDRGGERNKYVAVCRDRGLGNTRAFHKTRATLLEVDFIDHEATDRRFNLDPGAADHKQNVAEAIANALIEDLLA